jgi:2-polyprenyl-3-methyl-5-hydroxy-6-metoxy-1,4-benzoquinol methylase
VSDADPPPVELPDPRRFVDGDERHWFEDLADHMGEAYLRYSFTKGTVQEVDFIVEQLGLEPGDRVLDVGCGPGRHSLELARRGMSVHGVDVSETFVALARSLAVDLPNASFERFDARRLAERDDLAGRFDAVICLCQGAFGLMTADGDDERVARGLATSLTPSGRLLLSAFNAYFAVKYHVEASFDAERGVSHEVTEIRSPTGDARSADLWTGCYTPRELRMLMSQVGLDTRAIWSSEPGRFGTQPAGTESPEFLVLACRALWPAGGDGRIRW